MSAPRVAWIGMGQMGAAMSANIIRKGPQTFTSPFLLYNRTAARAEAVAQTLPKGQAKVVPTIEEAVQNADIIFTIISNDAATEETVSKAINAPGGIKGKLYVDSSTVASETTEKIAKMINDAGGEFLAMPIFGAAAAAQAGELVCVPAGPKSCVDRVRPFLLGVMGREIIDMSDEPYGKALQLKVMGNQYLLAAIVTLAETHVLAEKCGLGSSTLHKFVAAVFPGVYSGYSRRMISGDYEREDPAFHVDLARKDARHAMKLGEAHGLRLRNTETADAQLTRLQALAPELGLKGDLAQLYGLARADAGLSFKP